MRAELEADADQQRPVVAGNGTGEFLIAWQDERNGDWDIYASLFQSPLQADLSATPTSTKAALPVAFSDVSTPAGVADQWHWAFGDGDTASTQHPTHEYAKAGAYTVTLVVTDTDTGYADAVTRTNYITVTPVASFTAAPRQTKAGLTVRFTDTSTSGVEQWHWAFGDTGTSSSQHPTHEYAKAGVYTVTLVVTDTDTGYADAVTRTEHITVTPNADFVGAPQFGSAPLTVQFTNTTQGICEASRSGARDNDGVSYRWDLGDGPITTTTNPSHTSVALQALPGMPSPACSPSSCG